MFADLGGASECAVNYGIPLVKAGISRFDSHNDAYSINDKNSPSASTELAPSRLSKMPLNPFTILSLLSLPYLVNMQLHFVGHCHACMKTTLMMQVR